MLNVESEIEYSKNFNKKLVLKKSPAKCKAKSKDKKKGDQDEYEIACEAADAEETGEESGADDAHVKIGIMTESDKKFMIRVNGREETPSVPSVDADKSKKPLGILKKSIKSPKKPKCRLSMFKNKNKLPEPNNVNNNEPEEKRETGDESDGNNNNDKEDEQVKYSTLPMVNKQKHKRTIAIPQRTTSDGTQIYYLCDLPKKLKKGFFGFFLFFFKTF